jgi:hypothetical protein
MGKSLAEIKEERGIGGPPMLKGSDLGKTESKVKIKVKALREAPKNFGSPAIIDLVDEVHSKVAWACNITNLKALASLVGMDPDTADFDILAKKVVNKTFVLYVAMVNNPKTNKMGRSLFFNIEGV